MSIKVFCPFLNWVVCIFIVELQEFFIYFRYKTIIRYMIWKYFLPFCSLSVHFLDNVLSFTKVLIYFYVYNIVNYTQQMYRSLELNHLA